MTKNSKEDKPYKITFENRGSYLYAYAQGKEDSYEISAAFWTDIAKYCKENCFSKVLNYIDKFISFEKILLNLYIHVIVLYLHNIKIR